MKNIRRMTLWLVLLCIVLSLLAACNPGGTGDGTTSGAEVDVKDYASAVKLDMSSTTAKQKVTVKAYIDGDTTHFNVPGSIVESGVLKARYLAINTPESTGKIEEYGKKAMPQWIEREPESFEAKIVALPAREDIDYEVSENLIVELYSR